ncbi:hypothetical protein KM295_07775 [Natronomonas sp. F2-12]|mgnify:CR=1 FL=1|jgi:hypothetical protein|uniref:DUF7577 domain-containing protein n=1 Tax=Natronomonas aquatica TaxID=2841590 RepID=A0A9R1CQT1_9EURY|nr:hypothetical protein [Natronomonas aquatica]MCQ4333379.1 hypothetical protein [Natronomonas aquatica]
MEELVTAGAIAALLVGVHAVFAVYLYRVLSAEPKKTESTADAVERMGSKASDETTTMGPGGDTEQGGDRSTIPCPVCGVPNDPSFQFCRQCVADLSGGSMSVNGAADGSSG